MLFLLLSLPLCARLLLSSHTLYMFLLCFSSVRVLFVFVFSSFSEFKNKEKKTMITRGKDGKTERQSLPMIIILINCYKKENKKYHKENIEKNKENKKTK
jgi:hypothetical protein